MTSQITISSKCGEFTKSSHLQRLIKTKYSVEIEVNVEINEEIPLKSVLEIAKLRIEKEINKI